MESRSALFREIHKNTWLKRLTADGKKVTVGTKRSDRSWVVFCVHDDTEALLEGYAEPRVAPSHSPEWVISLQGTQHISHALVPNEQEYEFVITLSNEVVRFHAMSWDIMQEWVEALRSKLREMKILSPKENLYTKLPEARVPLLPTRDPTSPLPATPPVPAAIVPGVECVVPSANVPSTQSSAATEISSSNNNQPTTSNAVESTTSLVSSLNAQTTNSSSNSIATTSSAPVFPPANAVSMSNTLTQNLLNMLTNPISNYSVQINESHIDEDEGSVESLAQTLRVWNRNEPSSLARTFTNNVLNDSKTYPMNLVLRTSSFSNSTSENSIRVDVVSDAHTSEANVASEPSSPVNHQPESSKSFRSQTVRSVSLNDSVTNRSTVTTNNVTELDIQDCTDIEKDIAAKPSTNITIIQVSNPLPINKASEVFKFPPSDNLSSQEEYKSNVQIIPSSLNTIPIAINNQFSSPIKSDSDNPSNDTNQVTKVHVSGADLNNSYGKICTSASSTPKRSKKIILSASTSGVTNISVNNDESTSSTHYEKVFLTSSIPIVSQTITENSSTPSRTVAKNAQGSDSSQTSINENRLRNKNTSVDNNRNAITKRNIPSTSGGLINTDNRKSPLLLRKNNQFPEVGRENMPPPLMNRPLLTRGVTEAVITARPSRIDMKKTRTKTPSNVEGHNIVERTRSESLEQRRRSSSTSETQSPRQRQRDADVRPRITQTSQPFRQAQDNAFVQGSKKLTLREQQVMHLRREIMHPGGVRLQLRRKDCIGSIAWVDAFGAVWVTGWKQKEHPMLYNALHIGDQLISIAGAAISSASEANKVIRNTNTLFLEILIRRIPFGRVYAIRRDLEGQCLGLIRDGSTATIVDVVPNSLAARHGLPPKAQSCDGLSLTFWVLTEINGRPLNLFSKENEVRDRLNSVGRDISILVQPLDLVTKLKKQLKSLRSYKEYIVQ